MVLISQKKSLDLIHFELIIKRCPICLKDTEQTAYYVHKPDLSVEFKTNTTPQVTIKVLPNIEHVYEWYVLATCSSCKYTYKVTGVPKMKEKEIPNKSIMKDIELVLTCCDLCYNEYYRYVVGDVFINLSTGGKVYLCGNHAKDIEAERAKSGSYSFLINRMRMWEENKEVPIVVNLKSGGDFILKSFDGLSTNILLQLLSNSEMPKAELYNSLNKNFFKIKQKQLDECIGYLKGASLLTEKESGSFLKKRYLSLTTTGKDVAKNIKE
ncbi:MAG: hypothetical protein ACP5M9_01210 [Candidatus Micrarchaeia archaeon]